MRKEEEEEAKERNMTMSENKRGKCKGGWEKDERPGRNGDEDGRGEVDDEEGEGGGGEGEEHDDEREQTSMCR